MENKLMWIVGIYLEKVNNGVAWEFLGVFDSKDKAEKACTKPSHFYFMIDLNRRLPDDTVTLPTTYPVV